MMTGVLSNTEFHIKVCFCVSRLLRPPKDQAQGKAGRGVKVELQKGMSLLLVRLPSTPDQHQQNPQPIQV